MAGSSRCAQLLGPKRRAQDAELDALVGPRGRATLLRLLRRIVAALDGGAAPR